MDEKEKMTELIAIIKTLRESQEGLIYVVKEMNGAIQNLNGRVAILESKVARDRIK